MSEKPQPAPARSRPTMKDVAAHAGVGLKTVSRVVNAEAGVSQETAVRVRQAIAALGFRRNDGARQLRTGTTASVGLLLEDVADPFYSVLTRAVEEVVSARESLLFTGSSGEDPAREHELAQAFCARRVDGLIIVPAGADHGYLQPEIAAGLATVFVDRPPMRLAADVVLADNAGGTRSGVRHLLEHGHLKVGFLGDAPGIFTAGERLRGYREAMEEAGAPVDEAWIAMGPTDPASISAALDQLLGSAQPVTAIFTGNNRITIAVLRDLAVRRLAKRPAIVGFDDFELADMLFPGMTVVAQDPTTMGRTAAELLFARLDGDTGPHRRLELPTKLIPRGSGEIGPD